MIFLLIILTGWNCSSQPSNVSVKDKSQYDQSFIEGLARFKKPVRLVDNFIIAEGDTTHFPEILALKREVIFKGKKNDQQFVLTISRINLTTLPYSFRLTNSSGKSVIIKSGKAILGSMFFLGCEVDIDDLTGEGYSSYEYWDQSKEYVLSIRVGMTKDNSEKLRAKISYGGNSKSVKGIDLNECPTLRVE